MTNEDPNQAKDRILTPADRPAAERLLGIHNRLYKALLRLIPDLLSLQPATARRSKSGRYMDLHFDALAVEQRRGLSWLRFSLAHYYEQNGDLVADPDMEASICLDPTWPAAEALNITQAGLGIYREVYPEENIVDVRAKKELNDFLALWLRNLHDQGHHLGPETTRRRD